ncbi:MAG: exonuclease SbcCD subunit D [Actinomycetota bacterium]|nr:exonuclease SbcCD subunit D [Actinomycetota bacterium]
MKLLHTGDWHVGKTLSRRSRIDESRQVLDELAALATAEQVDVMLVTGDVFDQLSPSPDAEAAVYDALVEFERQQIPVAVIAGNHDHAHRWRALEPLLARFAIHVIPEPRRPEAGGIVEIRSRDGSTSMQIAALPWVPINRLVEVQDVLGLAEEPFQAYTTEMSRILAALCHAFDPAKCNVLVGHFYVSGAVPSGSERPLSIGELYAVTPQAVPVSPQYVALGHVHKPQKVPGVAVPARYAGSLLQLDFGEVGQEKSVVLVDLEPGKPAQVRQIALSGGRRLRDIRGTLDQLAAHADGSDDFLRVVLECDSPQPGLGDAVRDLLPNALQVTLDYPREEVEREVPDLRTLKPRELFSRFYSERHAAEPEKELLDLLDELLDEVTRA